MTTHAAPTLKLGDDEESVRRQYLENFFAKETSTDDVLSYRWPTQKSLGHFTSGPAAKGWDPASSLDVPPLPALNPPVVRGVAPLRKNVIQKDRPEHYSAGVDKYRPGKNHAPGVNGLGLTRRRDEFAVPKSPVRVNSRLGLSHHKGGVLREMEVGHDEGSVNPSEHSSSVDEDVAAKVAAMLSRALSPKASKGKLEENHWADVFNACSSNPHPASQPETSIGGGGEPAPYVERRASAHALLDASLAKAEAQEQAGTAAEGGAVSAEPSLVLRKVAAHPSLQNALLRLGDTINEEEWVAYCDAVRDLSRWNEF